MGRRLKANNGKDEKRTNSDVVVRNANRPRDKWTADAAIDLLRQGYTAEHVATVTGFSERWLLAQPVPREPYLSRLQRRAR